MLSPSASITKGAFEFSITYSSIFRLLSLIPKPEPIAIAFLPSKAVGISEFNVVTASGIVQWATPIT